MPAPIILSGIQPSGNLHIGNYLGAVKNWVDLQNSGQYDCYYCIVDYHALSGKMKGAELKRQIYATAAELLAAGLDPEKSTFFVQSQVPEHTELAWIFSTLTPVAELYRMTQFKDKSQKQEKNINAGLLTYPILQAADILLYHGAQVPVGKDQLQHLELTNDIARWFNKKYGEYFSPVKPLLTDVPKVMGLLEPEKKMSKSDGEANVIELADDEKIISAKLKKAVTATSGGAPAGGAPTGESPGVANLFRLLKNFGTAEQYQQFAQAEKTGTIKYAELKGALAEALTSALAGFRARRAELLAHPEKIESLLERGAARARAAAKKTMADVRSLVGVR